MNLQTTPFVLSRAARSSLLAALASLPAAGLLAQSTFLGSASGQQWGASANWSAGVPNAVDAVAVLAANGGISNIAINNPGLGYVPGSPPAVTISGGTGSGGVVNAIVSNRVAIIHVTDGGSGYTSAPTVTLSGGGGEVAANAVASFDAATGKVTGVTIQYGGYGFTSAPVVTLTGGGGSGATAEAHIAGGVTGFAVVSSGAYTVAPTVAVGAPVAGTAATVTATLTDGAVSGVAVGAAGAGFVAPPAVTFGAPPAGGTRATGYAVLADGAVSSIIVTYPGSGYTSAPSVALSAPVVTASAAAALTPVPYVDSVGGAYPYTVGTINVTYAGGGSLGRAETAADILNLAQGAGSPALATAIVTDGAVSGATIFDGGAGYDLAPVVVVTGGGGRGAVLQAVVADGSITGFTVVSGGSGYTSEPVLEIQAPAAPAINVTQAGGSLFFYGSIAGTQGFTKAGPGTLTFRFNGIDNPFTGPVYVTGGTLGIQSDGSLGDEGNDLVIAGGAKLLAQPSTNAPITLSPGRAVTLAGGTAQIGNASPYSGVLTIPAGITGAGGLTKTDGGALVLTGVNSYAGVTTIAGGLLVAGSPAALPGYRDPQDSGGALPARVVGSGSGVLTVRMGGAGEWTESDFDDLLNNGSFLAGNAIGIDTTNAFAPVAIDGLLTAFVTAPSYGFAKSGPGTLELTGANAYTGPTTIYEGTLKLAGGSLPATTALTFGNGGATVDLGGASQTVGTLVEFTGGGSSTVTNGHLTVTNGGLAISGNSGTLVDLSGLASFTYTPASGELKFETTNNVNDTVNTTLLSAATNTITAPSRVLVGGGASTSNGTHVSAVRLGATNTIRTALFQLGGFNTTGSVSFQDGVTTPALTLRAANGTDRLNVTVGETSSGARPGGGTLNTAGGTLDALVETLIVSRHIAGANNGAASSISLFAGVIDANLVVLGEKVNTGTPTLSTTVNQTGGEVRAPSFIVGRSTDNATAGGAANFQTTYNLSGGTLKAGSFQPGVGPFAAGSVRTLALGGGTLTHFDAGTDLVINGVAGGGGTIRVSAAAGTNSTIQVDAGRSAVIGANTELVAADATALVAKTGAGTLALEGGSTGFLGTIRLDAGALTLGAGSGIATVNAGAFIWNGGTIAFDLSTVDTTSDQIVLTGALLKGTGPVRTVDLKGAGSGTYTLATYASTDLVASDLTAANVPAGLNASFAVGATSLSVTVGDGPVLSALDGWRLAKLGTSENIGDASDAADPDNDGRANLLEYATGTEPLAADAGAAAILGQTGGKLTLTFERVADPALTYTVRASNDLTAAWSGAEVVFTSTGEDNIDGPVTAEDSALIGAQPRRFLRLEISY